MSVGTPSVLVVTKERLLGDLLKEALDHRQYACVVETLPTLAADRFRATRPALTIVDLSSLEYAGLDVIAEIRGHDPNAVVTAMIGTGQAQLESTAYTLGVTDVIQRHDDLAHMLHTVMELDTQIGSSDRIVQQDAGGVQPAGSSVPILGESASVLVVDDDATVRRLLERILTKAGYSVFTASDGIEAMEWLERVSVQVMFLDLRMPRLGGIGVLHRLKNLPPSSLRIVIISGLADQELKKETVALGAFDYLQKPLSIDRVLVTTSAALVLQSARHRSFWERWTRRS